MRDCGASESLRRFNASDEFQSFGNGGTRRSTFREMNRGDDRNTSFLKKGDSGFSSHAFRSFAHSDVEKDKFDENSFTAKRYQQNSRLSNHSSSSAGFRSSMGYKRFGTNEDLDDIGRFGGGKSGREFSNVFDDENRNSCRDIDNDSSYRGCWTRNEFARAPENHFGYRSGFLHTAKSEGNELMFSTEREFKGVNGSFNFNGNTRTAKFPSGDFDEDRDFNSSSAKIGGYGRGLRSIPDSSAFKEETEKDFDSSHSFKFDRFGGRLRNDCERFDSGSNLRGYEATRRSFANTDNGRANGFGENNFTDKGNSFSTHRFRSGSMTDSTTSRNNFRGFNKGFGNRDNDEVDPRFLEQNKELPKFSAYVPADRDLEELYEEDKKNAENMVHIEDLDLEVRVEGRNTDVRAVNLESWRNAGFDEKILENLRRCRYDRPRRIQSAVVPLIMNNYDLLGHAETGGGKTVAFLLPIIDHIVKNRRVGGSISCAPIALIVAPTRELILQLYDQGRKLAAGTNVTIAKAYGRYNVPANIAELQRGCDLLFATPGRLEDFVGRGIIVFNKLEYFVIDEADRMLESTGFQSQMLTLIRNEGFPKASDRHTLLFSATFDEGVLQFAQQLLKREYVFVTNGRVSAANIHVDQHFVMVTKSAKGDKLGMLLELLKEDEEKYKEIRQTLVFVAQQNTTDVVSIFLSHRGIKAISIHGGREQRDREEAINGFRKGDIKVLVATDVCARGIDIVNLDHVVNFDLPTEKLIYIHRIGRTGRLRRGTATSFINVNFPSDVNFIPQIIEVVREVNQEVPKFMLDIAQRSSSYLTGEPGEAVVGMSRRFERLACADSGRTPNESSKDLAVPGIAEQVEAKGCDSRDNSDNEGWD